MVIKLLLKTSHGSFYFRVIGLSGMAAGRVCPYDMCD